MMETTTARLNRRAEVKAAAKEVVAENAAAALKAKQDFYRAAGFPDQPEVAPEEIETEATGYADWTKDQLSEELQARGLAHSGNKDELIARLEESDES